MAGKPKKGSSKTRKPRVAKPVAADSTDAAIPGGPNIRFTQEQITSYHGALDTAITAQSNANLNTTIDIRGRSVNLFKEFKRVLNWGYGEMLKRQQLETELRRLTAGMSGRRKGQQSATQSVGAEVAAPATV